MTSPLVSVIVPIYKVEKYLCACVDSILAQTYKNIEIILVDDGSPDSCPKICDDYAQKDSRIRVIHKPNGGLSDARNVGMENANGDYFCFVDSDDMCHTRMIEALMNPILEDKSLLLSAIQSQNFTTDSDINFVNQQISDAKIIDFSAYMHCHYYSAAWGKIYHRTLFNEIKYPIGRLHEDEFVTYRICYATNKIAYNLDKLYFYRQRTNSITAQPSPKRIFDVYDSDCEKLDFFLNKKEYNFYSTFLISSAANYCKAIKYKSFVKDNKKFISQYKQKLSTLPLTNVSIINKLHFWYMIYFPRIRNFLNTFIPKR